MKEMTFPNGTTLHYLDKFTAEYIYKEIFEDEVYLQRGITIKDGDVIFDVGANTGYSSYFLSQQAKNLKFYTFEPVPAIFDVLEANMAKISDAHFVKNYNIGLAEKEDTIEINFLPHSSGDSAITPVDLDFKLKTMLENYQETVVDLNPAAKYVPKFLRKFVLKMGLKKYYKGKKIPVKLRPLSDIIAENNINTINLLKIDAENYEGPVIAGIRDGDWDKIQQIAMEVHTHIDGGRNLLQEMIELFTSKGFTCFEGDESLETVWGVYMLYARREN
ncbi:MAG: FkbM family methyltransferase [Promethearchaeota archaeon]